MTAMQPQKAFDQSDRVDALLAVLRSVCTEAHSLAFDIAGLGESLSSGRVAETASEQMQDLQSFDPLSQRALSMARLLHGIERLLSSHTADWKMRAEALIEAVPFHAERERFAAALQGHEIVVLDADASNSEGLDWF